MIEVLVPTGTQQGMIEVLVPTGSLRDDRGAGANWKSKG